MATEQDPTPRFPTMEDRKRQVQQQYTKSMAKVEVDPVAAILGALAADNSLLLHQFKHALTKPIIDGSANDQPPDPGKLDTVLRFQKETQKLFALERDFTDADPAPRSGVRR